MTAGEEQLLTAYLLSTGEIEEAGHFTGWYAAIRNGSAGGEVEYKEVLALAGAWRRGFHQGYVAAQEPPEAEGLPRPRRHYHVQAYRRKREPQRPIKNLAITTVTGGYLSRSAANRAAWRDFPEEITSVRECQDLDCGLVASQRGGPPHHNPGAAPPTTAPPSSGSSTTAPPLAPEQQAAIDAFGHDP